MEAPFSPGHLVIILDSGGAVGVVIYSYELDPLPSAVAAEYVFDLLVLADDHAVKCGDIRQNT